MQLPSEQGYFGAFGGRFVSETLYPALVELTSAFEGLHRDGDFASELSTLLRDFDGRPTPLYHAPRLSAAWGEAKVYLKREDLNHTGAHKINNTLGQGLLARRLGKTRVIAETGAGQHGVATATVCARLGLACTVYMGAVDMARQAVNVERMELLGAEVRPVMTGSRTLKDAVNEALRDWVATVDETHYLIGSAVGPHPFPFIVRHFQSVIGRETREQILAAEGRLPDEILACVGGGSNAMGMFHPFLEDGMVTLTGVEAGGTGPEAHAASLFHGSPGVLHGARTYLLQDDRGQISPTHSISAGLDYPASGPELAHLAQTGRAGFTAVSDDEAVDALLELTGLEGILPALESSHALAHGRRAAKALGPSGLLIVNLSGRGDKDMNTVRNYLARKKEVPCETAV